MIRQGLTSNQLKMIAIVTMIIDHIGYYFEFMLPDVIYITCRIIGRIAMPIFVFLLVQGYFKTSNIKKYIIRLFKFACITQVAILFVYLLNYRLIPQYNIGIYKEYNILFSFVLSLCFIYMIDFKNKILKSIIPNVIIKVLACTLIIAIYCITKIDYKFIVPLMAVQMYIAQILNKGDTKYSTYTHNMLLIIIVFTNSILQEYIGIFSLLSAVFIVLYNGKLGKESLMLKRLFYYVFPAQHALLYIASMLLYISTLK